MKPDQPRDNIEVVVLQRIRQQFEWQVRRDGIVLATGISSSVAQARLDGKAAMRRAIKRK
jgi:hypothetical protein